MANPFDQFDAAPVTGEAQVPQPVVIAPGQNVEEAIAAAAPTTEAPVSPDNPFNNPVAPSAELSNDEFQSQLYQKLNAGETADSILNWSKDVGHTITPNENFYENIRIRDEALRNKQKGSYGRVDTLEQGQSAPIDAMGETGALLRQGGNTVLFNFGDEIESALRAIPAALSGKDFRQAYEDRHADLQARNEVDWAAHPVGSTAGVATGALLGGAVTPSIMGLNRVREAGLGARALAGAAEGTAYGGLAATGEGKPGDRFANTGAGALIGGGIGGSATPAIAAIARIGRPVVERLVPNEARALAKRLGYDAEQIATAEQELARQRDLGVTDITLLDIIDEPGRNVIGTAGAHDAARATLQDVAAARTTQLPERVAGAADEIIAPPGTQAMGVADDIRSGTAAQRDAEIEAAMDTDIGGGLTLRNAPIQMTEDIADVLGTSMGQRAIRNVINSTADAEQRAAYEQLFAAARQRARSVDPRLSENAQQAAQGVVTESMPFTVGMSERIGRELNLMGRTTGNNALFSFGRTVRSGAEQSPRYRDVMARYGQMSDYANAVGVGSGVRTVMDEAGNVTRAADEGAGFLAEPATRFETRVGQLSDEPMVSADGSALTMADGTPAPSERDLARVGATEAVATRAGRGPAEAKSVASQLYDSPEQRARSVALLGEEAADRLAGRMREEVERVYRANRQATKEGPGKEAGMAAVESGVNAMYNPGPISAIREMSRFLHRIGLTERDALWIVRNATDPSQTQAIVDRLKKAGMDDLRARARADELRDAAVRFFTSSEES